METEQAFLPCTTLSLPNKVFKPRYILCVDIRTVNSNRSPDIADIKSVRLYITSLDQVGNIIGRSFLTHRSTCLQQIAGNSKGCGKLSRVSPPVKICGGQGKCKKGFANSKINSGGLHHQSIFYPLHNKPELVIRS